MSTRLDEVAGLTAADIMHRHLTTLPASTTVGELREYFAASASRRLALFVDGERFAGSLQPDELPDAPAGVPIAAHLHRDPVARVEDAAAAARDVALAHPSRRVAVVDTDGRLVGIIAINRARDGFCGA